MIIEFIINTAVDYSLLTIIISIFALFLSIISIIFSIKVYRYKTQNILKIDYEMIRAIHDTTHTITYRNVGSDIAMLEHLKITYPRKNKNIIYNTSIYLTIEPGNKQKTEIKENNTNKYYDKILELSKGKIIKKLFIHVTDMEGKIHRKKIRFTKKMLRKSPLIHINK